MKKIGAIILIICITLLGSQIIAGQNRVLADSVLRLHVLANSDSPEDQNLKLKVKDHIIRYMAPEFSQTKDINAAHSLTTEKLSDIQKEAEIIIGKAGYDYPVEVVLGTFEFPTKSYGNLVFPQGDYSALRIIIGEGAGKNWWCVLFPPLCMVSSSDKGLSMDNPREAKVSLKCLELLPQGLKLGKMSQAEQKD